MRVSRKSCSVCLTKMCFLIEAEGSSRLFSSIMLLLESTDPCIHHQQDMDNSILTVLHGLPLVGKAWRSFPDTMGLVVRLHEHPPIDGINRPSWYSLSAAFTASNARFLGSVPSSCFLEALGIV